MLYGYGTQQKYSSICRKKKPEIGRNVIITAAFPGEDFGEDLFSCLGRERFKGRNGGRGGMCGVSTNDRLVQKKQHKQGLWVRRGEGEVG